MQINTIVVIYCQLSNEKKTEENDKKDYSNVISLCGN